MNRLEKFNNWRKKQNVILLSGATGTGLAERHFNLDNDLWSANALVTAPNEIKDIDKDYFDHGSNIVSADTYQATVKGFKDAGYSSRDAKHYVKLAVKLDQKARNESTGFQTKIVSGSMGPYGAALHNGAEYTGKYNLTPQQYLDFHSDRFNWLVAAGCDVIQFETVPKFDEIRAISQIFKQNPTIPVIVTCTLKDEHHISDGTDLHKVQAFLEQQPSVVGYGINCCPPKYVLSAIHYLKQHSTTDQDIVAYPNAGADYDPKTKQWGKDIPHVFSKNINKWHQTGAKFVGGCCGITEKETGLVYKKLFGKNPSYNRG